MSNKKDVFCPCQAANLFKR